MNKIQQNMLKGIQPFLCTQLQGSELCRKKSNRELVHNRTALPLLILGIHINYFFPGKICSRLYHNPNTFLRI